MAWFRLGPVATVVVLAVTAAGAQSSGSQAYRALGIEPKDVLTGTALTSKVVPGSEKQIVCIATYFTGKTDKADAVNVRLGVFAKRDAELTPLFTLDLGRERGGFAANGDLQILDLDLDGVNEIVVSWDDYRNALVEERRAEVLVHEGAGFSTAWTGTIEYDATKAVRDVPAERRDAYLREFDWASTLRSHGRQLFFRKKVVAVAGERLDEPRVLDESFDLRLPAGG